MRDINQAILSSPVPVVTYVAPSGARAASAGTYMLYASHIAAMAPATNLGAATPVQIGGSSFPGDPNKKPGQKKDKNSPNDNKSAMSRKMVNDAVAYIRGLAELRGRNVEWAEKAVREAASLSAKEALEQNVINLIAIDLADLLKQLQDKTVTIQGADRQLDTQGLILEKIDPDWRNRLLSILTDPNVASRHHGRHLFIVGPVCVSGTPNKLRRIRTYTVGSGINNCRSFCTKFWCIGDRRRHCICYRLNNINGH